MEAVKVHRPQESASRGDDFDVKHRNTFCTFCRFHRDRARFDQVWVPATGLSSGLGCGDTIVATGLGAWPRRNLNPVGLLLAHRRNPARTLYPLPLKAVRFVQYRTHTECRGSARWQYRCVGQSGEVQRMKGPLLDTSISRGRSTTLLLFVFPTAKTSISQKLASYARLKPLNRSGSAPLHLHSRSFKTLLHSQLKPPPNRKHSKTLKRQKKKSIAGPACQNWVRT